MRKFKKIIVSPKGEKRVRDNHPWIYFSDITYNDEITDGEIIDVFNNKNKYLGSGFYNSNSKIRVRLLSNNPNETFDSSFFIRRVKYAIDYRYNVLDEFNSFRLIYGESDGLPGLTIDKFNDVIVSEVLSLGIDLRKDIIYQAITDYFKEKNIIIKGIYERNENEIREKEGLEKYKGWYNKPYKTDILIEENNVKYMVDIENGQKTGFFLDQKYNRRLISKLSKNRNVLDVCTHTGSFGLNALKGNSRKVVSVDISKKAIEDTITNYKLNSFSNYEAICSDAFEYLENINKGEFDLIILDPPAFTKSRKTIHNALSGYERLNYLAMKKLKRGSILATASCSHFASRDNFLESIHKASIQANVNLKLISETGPSPDHPELIGVPETRYLKFFIFEVF